MAARVPLIPAKWLIAALVFSGLAVAAMLFRAGIVIAPENRGFAVVALTLLSLAAVRFRFRQADALHHRQIRDLSEHYFLFMATCLLGVLASYPAAAATTGFADPALQRIDGALHF